MSSSSKWTTLAVLVLASSASSCAMVEAPQGKSPLVQAQMSPDSVVLDIFFVRFPFGREDANDRLWKEVDEQHLPVEVRRQLTKYGFRAGVVAGQLPDTLAQLLEINDQSTAAAGAAQQVNLVEMEAQPNVVRRHLQCRAGRRAEILASDVYDELPVLISEPGGLCGQTYAKAQGLLALKAVPLPDGRVRVDLVPELHHGDPRQRFVGDQGSLRVETGRPRRVFDNLALSATLAPGQLFVMSSLPMRPGSLGHHFFTTVASGHREQKLLVIRLSQTQHDGLFTAEDSLLDGPEHEAAYVPPSGDPP